MTERLSKLQSAIICAIANHTINTNEEVYKHGGYRIMKDDAISYSELFRLCESAWTFTIESGMYIPEKELRSAKSSFSRALRKLVEDKGLVGAYVLGWFHITREFPYVDGNFCGWQGAGRMRTSDRSYKFLGKTMFHKDKEPVYRMLTLTDKGWLFAQQRGLIGSKET